MTYGREAGTWPAIATGLVAAIGEGRCAAVAGVSRSRLQQLKNPMRDDWRTLDLAIALDRLAASGGLGTPFADEMRRRSGGDRRADLGADRGAANPVPPVPAALKTAVAAAAAGLRRIADALAAAVDCNAGLAAGRGAAA